MIKRRRIRGVHDIVTMNHEPRRKDGIEIDVDDTGLGGIRSADRSMKKVTVVQPRTWVFSTKPKFISHQKPIEKSLLVEKVEEPVVDVFEKIKKVVVLAEMPGADKESINCIIRDDILVISAEATDCRGEKKYEKEVLLPFIASPSSLKTSYENQVLEIKLARKKERKARKSKKGRIK